ncbi:helicase [Agromyces sp. MMS17-SY077]|uniref:Helicase n=1 Tax=Agromyces seonyuensis TaxID=2662446 RepID=A0A6I4P4A5_9MICO|nr:helicase [Agromyces seonyuensis]
MLTTSVVRQRAANAADAAALAAADVWSGAVAVDLTACEAAETAARLGGAVLASCEVDEGGAQVTVSLVSVLGDVVARSRAGPPGAS